MPKPTAPALLFMMVACPESAQELLQLCAEEPFVDQPAVASCSGVLIDEDLVLTVGHCFEVEARCDTYAHLFEGIGVSN